MKAHQVKEGDQVSILTPRERRVRLHARRAGDIVPAVSVSILTPRERRVRPELQGRGGVDVRVSILTPRERRVRLGTRTVSRLDEVFQSSPHANAGCDSFCFAVRSRRNRFQSSPHANAGCDAVLKTADLATELFQSSPHANAGCDAWAMLGIRRTQAGFNPHPTRTQGATYLAIKGTRPMIQFQSSPHANAGCDRTPVEAMPSGDTVSILTPRERRVRRWRTSRPSASRSSFNPHPTRTQGATRRPWPNCRRSGLFQSSPHANAGCDSTAALSSTFADPVSILTPRERRVRRRVSGPNGPFPVVTGRANRQFRLTIVLPHPRISQSPARTSCPDPPPLPVRARHNDSAARPPLTPRRGRNAAAPSPGFASPCSCRRPRPLPEVPPGSRFLATAAESHQRSARQ